MNRDERLSRVLAQALESPLVFSTLILTDPSRNAPFQPNYVQQQVFTAPKLRNYICVHRRSGKCVVGSTRVVDPVTLMPTRIDCLQHIETTKVFDLAENRLVDAPALWVDSGIRDCVKVRLSNGTALGLTGDHPLYERTRGWVEAGGLKPGDQILVPPKLDVFGDVDPSDEDIETVVALTLAFKVVADPVFRYTEEGLERFFRRYWIENGRLIERSMSIVFPLGDVDLARDVQHLLHRLGVLARVDRDGSVVIDTLIDQRAFLIRMGVNVEMTDIPGPRRWVMVDSVRPMGKNRVYDVSVDHESHDFIADGVVAHNSYGLPALILWHALRRDGQHIMVVAPSSRQIKVIFDHLDAFTNASPIVKDRKYHKGNSSSPYELRTFRPIDPNGRPSTIVGVVAGYGNDSTIESARGQTPDAIFVDEAQDIAESAYPVLEPMMIGDMDGGRYNNVYTYFTGTIKNAVGTFYRNVYLPKTDPNAKIVFIPITENPSYTPEQLAEIEATVTAYSWRTEYLLEVTEAEDSVFRKVDIDACLRPDWQWGRHLVNPALKRVLCIDWDKRQSGTNILVMQYDPESRVMRPIYHEEVPRGEFVLHMAMQRALDIFNEFECEALFHDNLGLGHAKDEDLRLAAIARGDHTLLGGIQSVSLNKWVEIKDPVTGELVKKRLKPFLVERLREKFQAGELLLPDGIDKTHIIEQFRMYREIARTHDNIRYASENEHVVDCFLFSVYWAFLHYEDEYTKFNPELKGIHTVDTTVTDDERTDMAHELMTHVERSDRIDLSLPFVWRESFDEPLWTFDVF